MDYSTQFNSDYNILNHTQEFSIFISFIKNISYQNIFLKYFSKYFLMLIDINHIIKNG